MSDFSILNARLGVFSVANWKFLKFTRLGQETQPTGMLTTPNVWQHQNHDKKKHEKKNDMHNLRPVAWIIIKLCNFLLRNGRSLSRIWLQRYPLVVSIRSQVRSLHLTCFRLKNGACKMSFLLGQQAYFQGAMF